MKKFGTILWGIVFIVIGIIVLLNTLNVTHINIFFDGWWALFIIVPSFIGIIKDDNKLVSAFICLLGIALLLAAQGIMNFGIIMKCALPLLLIVIGFNILFKDIIGNKLNQEIKKVNEKNGNKDGEEHYATFSGQKLDYVNEEFKGAELNAIFGGIDLNLKGAIIKEDVIINACAVFGGIDIIAPEGVKVKSNSIFGGVSNKVENKKEGQPTIYITALCMFGGVDVK